MIQPQQLSASPMKCRYASLFSIPALLALSATALAEPKPGSIPLAPAENRRPADWKPTRPEINLKSLIEASVSVREKATKAYEELQQTNASGKWKATAASIDQHQAPEWFKDAKFGMFIDWGPWSIAGWAPKQKGQMIPDWYEMDMYRRKDFAAYHEKNWGKDFQRDDFLAMFQGDRFDPKGLVDLAEQAGMKYVVPFSKHHAGFCLWPSEFTQRDVGDIGSKRDVMGPLVERCREKNLKFGFYFSVEEWEYPILDEQGNLAIRGWAGKKQPFTPDMHGKISGKIPVKDFTTEYLVPQAKEFIDRYDPDLIWYDGEWESKAAMLQTYDIAAYLYNKAEGRKEVAVNDRYGKDETDKWLRSRRGDFFTSEFGHMGDASTKDKRAWEECRGISQSYGYNWQDTDENVINSKQLIDMFVDIVAGGGNLLLMVNLDGRGGLPKIQETRLRSMGEWLKVNGEGIYNTRPYRSSNPKGASSCKSMMTQSKDGKFAYVILKEWPGAHFGTSLVEPKADSRITLLGHDKPLEWSKEDSAIKIQMPVSMQDAETRTGQYAWVLKIEVSHVNTSQIEFTQDRLGDALASVRKHRTMKEFSLAMSELDALRNVVDKKSQAQIRMARAEVHYDMENYVAACDEIERALEHEPKYPDALILRGKCHLKMAQLDNKRDMDCFIDRNVTHEVKLGAPVTINLLAPSLEFAGDIEVVITSALGDRETIALRPLEADKSRFRAQLPTKEGKPQSDDKVLQTQVGDEITIEYSPTTKVEMNMPTARAGKCKIMAGD